MPFSPFSPSTFEIFGIRGENGEKWRNLKLVNMFAIEIAHLDGENDETKNFAIFAMAKIEKKMAMIPLINHLTCIVIIEQ